jgi:hypothetical protein
VVLGAFQAGPVKGVFDGLGLHSSRVTLTRFAAEAEGTEWSEAAVVVEDVEEVEEDEDTVRLLPEDFREEGMLCFCCWWNVGVVDDEDNTTF